MGRDRVCTRGGVRVSITTSYPRKVEPTPAITLRVLRERAGLTIEELADAAGFTPAFVRTIESGKLNANLFVLARLAQAIAHSLRQGAKA